MIKALSIFSGNANRELAEAICRCVEVRLGAAERLRGRASDGDLPLGDAQDAARPVNEDDAGSEQGIDARRGEDGQ